MTERHTADGTDQTGSINRRKYLKLAGVAAAITGTGMIGTAGAAQSAEPQVDRVVNLADEGLSAGDTIDSYLEEHFSDGVEVRIPEGEYDWEGDGFGASVADAAVVGQGEVILNTVNGEYGSRIRAEGGVVQLQNMTVRGPVAESRIRLEAADDARIVVDNWNFPDGTDGDGGDSKPFYVPGEHAGEVEFRNCYIHEFDDNGIYASSPGKSYGEGGRVVIDSCFVHNCNVAGFRLGGRGSTIRNSVVLNDGPAPATESGGIEQRGIRLENADKSKDMLVENCDVIHTHRDEDESSNPILFREADGSTGHIENVRIRNDTPHEAIEDDSDVISGWTGNNIDLTGDGDLSVPSKFTDVCTGAGCTEASVDIPAGTPSDGDDGADAPQDDGSSGGSVDQPTRSLEIVASSDNPDTALNVSVTTAGRIDFGPEAESDRDTITQNDDGTYTATSVEMDPGATDSYRFEGDVLGVDYTEGYEVTVSVDGSEVSLEEFTGDGSDSSTDDSSGGSSDSPADDGSSDGSTGSDLTKRVIVDGTGSDEFSEYVLVVSGEIAADSAVSSSPDATPWDQLEDLVDGNKVIGTVGKGIDGYRYSGEITSLQIDGDVDLTIEDSSA